MPFSSVNFRVTDWEKARVWGEVNVVRTTRRSEVEKRRAGRAEEARAEETEGAARAIRMEDRISRLNRGKMALLDAIANGKTKRRVRVSIGGWRTNQL